MTNNTRQYLAIATRILQPKHCSHSPSSLPMKTGEVQKDPLLIWLIRDSFIKNMALEEFLKSLNKVFHLASLGSQLL